jgi:hypothetical protein
MAMNTHDRREIQTPLGNRTSLVTSSAFAGDHAIQHGACLRARTMGKPDRSVDMQKRKSRVRNVVRQLDG